MSTQKIRQPVTRGCARVPVVMQMEAVECGAAALAMVLAYYGKWAPLEQVRAACDVSRDGSNAKNILKAAQNYGLTVKGCRCEPEALAEAGAFPCIIHWDFDHFVVLDGFRRGRAVLNDPARGCYSVSMEEFDRSFTGVCLMFQPGEDFQPEGRQKSMLAFARRRLKGAEAAVAFVALTTLIASLFQMINPVLSRIFLDRLLTHRNPKWLVPFLCVAGGLALIQIVTLVIKCLYSMQINGKLAVVGNTSYLWHVLNLPMEFFSQRLAGDIQQRKDTNAGIANSLVNLFAPLALNAAMMVFYLVVMLRYSPLLTAVGGLSVVINLGMSNLISRKRMNLMRVQLRDAGKLESATVAGIEMIEAIKSSGAENGYFEKWAGYQASVNTMEVRFLKLSRYLGLLPSLVSALTNTAVLALGVWLTMNGEFTVGMIMAFQGFLSSFTAPAAVLISAGGVLQEMRSQMERVEDVMEYPADIHYEEKDADASYGKLSGEVELRDVAFGYSRLGPPLIEHFNLKLKPGSRVAFVGPSGCGKSTMAKLISGLYEPWSGEVLFDGKPVSKIDHNVFTGSLAVVDQDIILFEDTIANNIKMWDESIEDFEVIMASRDAQLHEDIMQRDGGYQYRITEGGKDFSGGQRQRMEIARALAQDPTIIIMDEATSDLDARTEYNVAKSIRDRGVTCIIVSHRLSTVRDCDEIVVMDQGHVVERGTHEELYAMGGAYARLISSE